RTSRTAPASENPASAASDLSDLSDLSDSSEIGTPDKAPPIGTPATLATDIFCSFVYDYN
ncbi:hypothetical protein, partial [Porphyromonas sp. HMSC077F02]|uniref:hypothetical protein n=1 Tax=Porphyromonas sp. HMSC077F02 TaxID=1739529 RepID=UPI001AEF91B4